MKRDPSIFKDPKKGNVSNAGEDVMTMSQRLDSLEQSTYSRLDGLERTMHSLQGQIENLPNLISLQTKALMLEARGQASAGSG